MDFYPTEARWEQRTQVVPERLVGGLPMLAAVANPGNQRLRDLFQRMVRFGGQEPLLDARDL